MGGSSKSLKSLSILSSKLLFIPNSELKRSSSDTVEHDDKSSLVIGDNSIISAFDLLAESNRFLE